MAAAQARMEFPSSSPETLEARLVVTRRKIDNARRQIMFLDRQIEDLQRLRRRALENQKEECAYDVALRLMTANNIRKRFYHYVNLKQAELDAIKKRLEETCSTPSEFSSSDED